MPKDATARARLDPELKEEAETILAKCGLTPSQGIGLFYRQVVLNRGLPFLVQIPDAAEPGVQSEPEETPVPGHLRKYFWDYPDRAPTWERGRHTIILRLLQSGGMDALGWLRSRVTDAELREFLVRRQGRGLDPRRLRFWGLLLDLPRADVDRWIANARTNPWNRRTH